VQRAYNFKFVSPDLGVRVIAAVDLPPDAAEFRGTAESLFKDLFQGDLAETLLIFAGYENPDLA